MRRVDPSLHVSVLPAKALGLTVPPSLLAGGSGDRVAGLNCSTPEAKEREEREAREKAKHLNSDPTAPPQQDGITQ